MLLLLTLLHFEKLRYTFENSMHLISKKEFSLQRYFLNFDTLFLNKKILLKKSRFLSKGVAPSIL